VSIVGLTCKKPASAQPEFSKTIEFVSVQKVDFFAETDTNRMYEAGERWFAKGLHALAENDTAQARLYYKKALLSGYPVSRQYLMPVGL